ncbi:MAG: YbaK/EbsC family protein [Acidimicrobiia bacterium]|nr:YbaK/EbsC family protein [Acidimicrobiia bacterium]
MELPAASARVIDAARALGLEIDVRLFPDGTKTSEDAAAAAGCPLAAITKSLVFLVDDEPVLALLSGDERLDPRKLAAVAGGAKSTRADLDTVRQVTGFVAGGTPPFGHSNRLRTFADHGLRRIEQRWVAGGTPTTIFELPLDRLIEASGAVWADLSAR